jgi:hypothetical protein
MSNRFSRSWEITKLSFNVMRSDTELLLFPILSVFFSLVFILALIFPMFMPVMFDGESINTLAVVVNYIILFLMYLGIAFIGTFFNVCVVYTTKTRFDGGDATFMDSIRFAFSKIHLIFSWSLVSATVGLLLKTLTDLSQRLGPIGHIIFRIFIGFLGMAWGIITLFIVPSMVYNNLGPFSAIKKSVQVLKKTWGESLIRHFGLGFVQFVFFMVGLFLLIFGIVLANVLQQIVLIYIFLAIYVFYVMFIALFFGILNSIFNTALYVYADTGEVPLGYNLDVLENAFKSK